MDEKYIVEKVGEKYLVKPNSVIETEDTDVIFESDEPFPTEYRLVVEGLTEEKTSEIKAKLLTAYKDNKDAEEVLWLQFTIYQFLMVSM